MYKQRVKIIYLACGIELQHIIINTMSFSKNAYQFTI